MKGIDIFFKTLIKDGVDHVFSPPNSFGPTIDKLFKNKYSKNLKNIISEMNKVQVIWLMAMEGLQENLEL